MSPERPPERTEGRKLLIIAACTDCNFYSQLPTTTFRLAEDSALLQDTAQIHQIRYGHKVNFKIGQPPI